MTEDLSLGVRAGLPDPLRVLVEAHPRLTWEGHPHFTELTRFWLDRHLAFRRLQGRLETGTRAFLAREREPRDFAAGLVQDAQVFLSELHLHHNIEDHQYFPLLRALDARIEAGFDLLESDHAELDGAIHGLAERTNAVLRAIREGEAAEAAAGALETRLASFGRLIDRHLNDEEELVVPVILEHPEAGL